ncbi:hypothetical protein Pmar_PMAR020903, partial [Perkinsus marinus ATCC 50983]
MLALAQATINSTDSGGTRPCPHTLIYGWEPMLPVQKLLKVTDVRTDWEDLRPKSIVEDPLHTTQVVEEAKHRAENRRGLLSIFQEAWLERRQQSFKHMEGRKNKGLKKKRLQVGDRVLWLKPRKKKLSPLTNEKTYQVIEKVGKQCFRLAPIDESSDAPKRYGEAKMPVVHHTNLYRVEDTSVKSDNENEDDLGNDDLENMNADDDLTRRKGIEDTQDLSRLNTTRNESIDEDAEDD